MRTHHILSIRNATVTLLAIVTGLVSCVKDDLGNTSCMNTEGVQLSVSIPEAINISNIGSRAGVSDFNKINDLNVIVAAGDKISHVYWFDSFKELHIENNTATLTPTDFEEPKARIWIKEGYKNGIDYYLVANHGAKITETSVEAMKQITQDGAIPAGCKMYAKAENPQLNGDIYILSAKLNRTVAMVSIALEDVGLAEGVEITPTSISLHHVPQKGMIGTDNRISEDNNWSEVGESKAVPTWGTLGVSIPNADGTVTKIKKVGSHAKDDIDDPYFDPLFMYENLQGDGTNTDDQKLKDPAKLGAKSKYASYIQIDAGYASREKNVYGTVRFKFCLGKDIFNNFDVSRNTHYQVTLQLKGYVVTEGGQINEDGTLKAKPSDATWRVETELDAIDFTSNTNVVNQGGGIVYLTVEGGAEKDWWLKSTSSLSSQGDQGVHMWDDAMRMWMAVASGQKIKSTNGAIPIAVEGVDPEVDYIPGTKEKVVYTIELYDKEPGRNSKPVKTLTITRYPAKKVTMNIPGDGPLTYYVDAVDREPLPWGYEDVMFTDHGAATNGPRGFYVSQMLVNNYREQSLRYMPYGTAYKEGSAMMAAAFMNLYPNGNGAGGSFLPSWAPDEAPQQLPDLNEDTKRKYFYTIPSIAQWQFIEKAMKDIGIDPNAADENCRLKPYVKYWTANHATDDYNQESGRLYSYTYEILKGYDTIKETEPYYSFELRVKKQPYRCIIIENPKFQGY